MTARADKGRERAALRLGFAAVASAALAFALVARDAASRQVETVEGLVAPDWSRDYAAARSVHVVSPDGQLTIERADDGAWTLEERAGYPVEPASIAALNRSLAGLRLSGARSSNPENHDRLGVSDPAEGGKGVHVTIADAEGAALADLIFGAERAGGAFIRRPGEAQTYAATGEIPDFADPGFWLDLDFLDLFRVDIAEVEITPEGAGPAFTLARGAPAASDFRLVSPEAGWALITAGAANGPGAGVAELRFLDVRTRMSLETPRAGRHTAQTFDGLTVTLDVYRDGEDDWATIDAQAGEDAGPEVAARARALMERTGGWAYKLPEYAADRLIRPLTGIAQPVDGGAPE